MKIEEVVELTVKKMKEMEEIENGPKSVEETEKNLVSLLINGSVELLKESTKVISFVVPDNDDAGEGEGHE